MIPISETYRKKKIDNRKNRKRKSRQLTENADPRTMPTRYLYYGKGAYVILCYASMRSRMKSQEKEWFTTQDYVEFQELRTTIKQCQQNFNSLAKFGYLTRRPMNRTHPQWGKGQGGPIRYEYRFTDLGQHALTYVAQAHRKRHQGEDDE